jgi:hypothetical protein
MVCLPYLWHSPRFYRTTADRQAKNVRTAEPKHDESNSGQVIPGAGLTSVDICDTLTWNVSYEQVHGDIG